MVLEIKEAKKINELNGLQDVIHNVTVLIKEFDDSVYLKSCVDNKEQPDPSKVAAKVSVFVNLPAPSADSFTPIEEITKESVLSWIESNEKIMKGLSKRLDQALHARKSKANQPISSTVEFN